MTARRATFLIPGRDLAAAVGLVRRAEGLGYDSVWVTHGLGRDSFLVLAAYGAATTRLGLGTGVVPIYPRHPAVMAQAALTLSEMTGGRFRLGLGVSHRSMMEDALGLRLAAPLEVMREYVAVLRGA
ncbi:MAG: LLM class flavin-dependent oxidoreductase, partial [Candidatus Rokubacteria bacterium]|nr:LLM class flavin-dependent oxidoreductase [Candidatus Rokubacteria bacterium]